MTFLRREYKHVVESPAGLEGLEVANLLRGGFVAACDGCPAVFIVRALGRVGWRYTIALYVDDLPVVRGINADSMVDARWIVSKIHADTHAQGVDYRREHRAGL